jgi:hypothetical protein
VSVGERKVPNFGPSRKQEVPDFRPNRTGLP